MAKLQQGSGTRIQQHNHVSWIDVQNPGPEVFTQLENAYHLHPIHLNESVQKIQLNRVERERHYLFLLLHIPTPGAISGKIPIDQLGIFLGKDFLITIHDGQSALVEDLFEIFARSPKHKAEYQKNGAGYLLYGIIKRLLSGLSDSSEAILTELDEIETLVFDNNKSDAFKIGKVRQAIVRQKRVIDSLRIVLSDLTQQIGGFTGAPLTKLYANNAKTADKLWEVIEEAKETVEIYKDADFTSSTEQTNGLLAVLTLVFTFTIPITVVGTLYGMNVTLPGGLVTGSWNFFGTYTTLGVLVTGSVVAALLMYLYFKRKKWF